MNTARSRRPSIIDRLRGEAMTGSILVSWAAALPIYAITGSTSKAQNFGLSLFADLCSAMVGMDMNVKGEHNAWRQRPAVFIFNHQSHADLMVIARLVRRDLAAVGKREIGDMPILGKVLGTAGAVFIDRENTASAIEAMQPLVDAIRREGKSVMLAPEGTRSDSGQLLAFKKGAFHLAMQAGVPVVPVVIHNAWAIQPKGESTFRPGTVDVEVLPPVDTGDWTREDMGKRIEAIHRKYLRILGQTGNDSKTSRQPR